MCNDTMPDSRVDIVTVTLNPAIDQTVTIPNFAVGTVNRVEQMQQNPGGKGVNVAAVLADAGHSVAVSGFLGRENDASFTALFEQKRIADRFVCIAGQTRVGIKIVDPSQRQTTDINFPGQAPTPAELATLFQTLLGLDGAWFVLAGSLPQNRAPVGRSLRGRPVAAPWPPGPRGRPDAIHHASRGKKRCTGAVIPGSTREGRRSSP